MVGLANNGITCACTATGSSGVVSTFGEISKSLLE